MIPFLLVLLSIGSSKPDHQREYPVYRLPSAPLIDGIVSEENAWSTIPRDGGFVTPYIAELRTHLPAYKQSSFKIGFDKGRLFVALLVAEPWTRYLSKTPQTEPPYEIDDGVTFVVSSSDDSAESVFTVNAAGAMWADLADGQTADDAEWDARVIITDTSYTVEMSIPFEILGDDPIDGDVWHGNVIRHTHTIISPEDRFSSWAPVSGNGEKPEGSGRFVFRDQVLSAEETESVQLRLRKVEEQFMALEDQFLLRSQATEDSLSRIYRTQVNDSGRGLLGTSKGPADLVEPPSAPASETWRYGLGFPMQISPTKGALLTNIRMVGSGNIDFEIGTDVVLFDDLDTISASNAIPISRYERDVDPVHGDIIVRKGPVIAGFVPYGALLEDGSPHPHAGTGFGIGWAISHEIDSNGKFEYTEFIERYAMGYQFSFDGEQFRVLDERRIDASKLLPDWNLVGNFVTNAIPDGEDLLYVMIARVGEVAVAGYTRWQYGSGRWAPVSFTPVTGFEATWSEPSLVRDRDGSLVFSARSHDLAIPMQAFDIGVWRSDKNGENWERVIAAKNRRARSPVSINRTVDGTPFIAANTPPYRRTREVLSIWPLNESRTDLEGRITARDARSEFGPAPSGSWWRIDHPTSAVIRLADLKWHSVLGYRIVDNGEVEGNAPPAPQTGCYVEEVFSAGDASPMWKFD